MSKVTRLVLMAAALLHNAPAFLLACSLPIVGFLMLYVFSVLGYLIIGVLLAALVLHLLGTLYVARSVWIGARWGIYALAIEAIVVLLVAIEIPALMTKALPRQAAFIRDGWLESILHLTAYFPLAFRAIVIVDVCVLVFLAVWFARINPISAR